MNIEVQIEICTSISTFVLNLEKIRGSAEEPRKVVFSMFSQKSFMIS